MIASIVLSVVLGVILLAMVSTSYAPTVTTRLHRGFGLYTAGLAWSSALFLVMVVRTVVTAHGLHGHILFRPYTADEVAWLVPVSVILLLLAVLAALKRLLKLDAIVAMVSQIVIIFAILMPFTWWHGRGLWFLLMMVLLAAWGVLLFTRSGSTVFKVIGALLVVIAVLWGGYGFSVSNIKQDWNTMTGHQTAAKLADAPPKGSSTVGGTSPQSTSTASGQQPALPSGVSLAFYANVRDHAVEVGCNPQDTCSSDAARAWVTSVVQRVANLSGGTWHYQMYRTVDTGNGNTATPFGSSVTVKNTKPAAPIWTAGKWHYWCMQNNLLGVSPTRTGNCTIGSL